MDSVFLIVCLCFFRGMTTIDIALTNVDINQCDRSSGGQFQFEIFAGTHRCKNETTQVRYQPEQTADISRHPPPLVPPPPHPEMRYKTSAENPY